MPGEIRVETRKNVAHIIISNEARRNAISSQMWEALLDAVKKISSDDSLRAVVLEGAGESAFSAGADIKEFAELLKDSSSLARNNKLVQEAQRAVELLEKPTIAKIRGACIGGGCGLALACDFRVAAPDARFGITPAKLGLLYSLSDTRRLYNLVGPGLCRDMLYTGRILEADEARKAGLITRLIDGLELDTAVAEFADELAEASRYSLRGIKATLGFLEGSRLISESDLQDLFDSAFDGDDFEEGRRAFLEKRKADFR